MKARLSEAEKAMIRRAMAGGPVSRFLVEWVPAVVMLLCLAALPASLIFVAYLLVNQ